MIHKKRLNPGFWFLAAILATGFTVYSNTFFAPFHFDDNLSIVDNPALRHLDQLKNIWSFWPTRFITTLSFALNYYFHGLNVFGYHLVNLAAHLGSAVLVWRLCSLTFLTPAMKGQKIAQQAGLISFFAGLVFVSHPIQTQAVTYIVQRAASLATFFYLASLCLYVRSRLLEERQSHAGFGRLLYAGSLAMGVAAMFTKEMAATLPLAIWLYEGSFFAAEKKGLWKRIAPFLATLSIIPFTMWATHSVNFGEMRRVGEPLNAISPWDYLLTQLGVVMTYLRLLLAPVNQNIDYDVSVAHTFLSFPALTGFFVCAGLLVAGLKLFPRYRLVAFGIFWFFLALLPESSVIPIRDVVFEHRLYLPMAGFSIVVASAWHYLFEKKDQRIGIVVFLIVIAGAAALAHARNAVWKSDISLWDDAVKKSPAKARPYNNRGLGYAAGGDAGKAIADFSKAISLKPDFVEAYNNRGSVYLGRGEFDPALADYRQALALEPRYAEAYHNRGLAYAGKGDFDKAIQDFNKALEIKPDYAEAYYDRGNAFYRKGRFDEALADYNKALKIIPGYAEAYNNRGSVYYNKGDMDQAVRDYDFALKIKPDYAEARNNRAAVRK